MISQLDLIQGIMGVLVYDDKDLKVNSRQMNAIIDAANNILAELNKPSVLATPLMGLEAWMFSDDTGASSLWMAYTFYHDRTIDLMSSPKFRHDQYKGNQYPRDPDDFGRCYRFLRAIPTDDRKILSKMVDTSEEWALLVSHWDELEKLFEEESPSGSCPKLMARMNELYKRVQS
jgi:hypothetical protein